MPSRYERIIETVFFANYSPKKKRVPFGRQECVHASEKLGIDRIRNLGDIMYSFRFRRPLPETILETAPRGCEWIILGAGVGRYEFRLGRKGKVQPAKNRRNIKIPDATPEVVRMYMPSKDEQALLTRARYNRVIDLFTGLTCYSVQNHLRTTVQGIGQIEVDEIYFGVSSTGAHFAIPCQAKSPGDSFGIVQVLQDMALCRDRYPQTHCRPVALQFKEDDAFAILELDVDEEKEILRLVVVEEKHFRFVHRDELSNEELHAYLQRELS